jgi:hypothetical protein
MVLIPPELVPVLESTAVAFVSTIGPWLRRISIS